VGWERLDDNIMVVDYEFINRIVVAGGREAGWIGDGGGG
jgi:hypothetical protein